MMRRRYTGRYADPGFQRFWRELGGRRDEAHFAVIWLVRATVGIEQQFAARLHLAKIRLINVSAHHTGRVKESVNTVLPALSMLPGSTARVISVPSDGAINVVSCRSSSARANCACACSRLAFARQCPAHGYRCGTGLAYPEQISASPVPGRGMSARFRSLAEIVRLFHKPC